MSGTIYVLRNTINGKMYVGQTIHNAHCRILGHKGHPNMVIGRAVRKYGYEAFEITEMKGIPDYLLDDFEIGLIASLGTIVPKGYNAHGGGRRRHVVTEATKKKISAAKMGTTAWNKGKHWSDDMKKLLSQKCSGYHHTKEALAKIRSAPKGKISGRARPVFCMETGQVFPSILHAAKWTGGCHVGIQKVCAGNLKTSGGKHWAYMEAA